MTESSHFANSLFSQTPDPFSSIISYFWHSHSYIYYLTLQL